VSDLKQLAVERGLDLLEQLQEVLAFFKNEETRTERRLRERRQEVRRASEGAMEKADRLLSEGVGEAEGAFDSAKERFVEIHDRREARIGAFVNSGRRNLPRFAKEAGERWLGGLQMSHFTTSRRLKSERATAEAKFEQAQQTLAPREAALRVMERQAREYFLGYATFLFALRARPAVPNEGLDSNELLDALDAGIAETKTRLEEFRRIVLPKIFSVAPLWAVLPILVLIIFLFFREPGEWNVPAAVCGFLTLVLLVVHALSRSRAKPAAESVVVALVRSRNLLAASRADATQAYTREIARLDAETAALDEDVERKWERAEEIKADLEKKGRLRFDAHGPRAFARNARMLAARLARLETVRDRDVARARAEGAVWQTRAVAEGDKLAVDLSAEESAAWRDLESKWLERVEPIFVELSKRNAIAAAAFPPWSREFVERWLPPLDFTPATKFAHLEIGISSGPGTQGSRLRLPDSAQPGIPLALTYPEAGSLLFEVNEPVGEAVTSCMNQIILRLLATTPPAKLSFTILDPVGLGQNFAGLMHLGDYEESLITRRIWTQAEQIEARLAELNQHIEKIIQMYLRDEYPSIVEYNAQAGSTAEKHHFLVIADFPANFSETAIKRLQSIITSGPRCGVYTLIHWDKRHPMPSGFVADELRANSICIQGNRSGLFLESGPAAVDVRLVLDPAPPSDLALEFVQKVGGSSVDANPVQVPFRSIAPAELWKSDTENELRVAIGRTGATKHQMLAIGKGTRQHALLAGKTGSGKSTLFHVLITNLALTCSPEQVEFYLIDFKKGVEFKCYAEKKLPHARVVAIESDRDFGVSVLQRVDEELRRRGDLFRKLGVQDVAGYRRARAIATPGASLEPMPRTLLIIDEFQELFVEDDAVAQNASVLLDRIVRQGRAFGIHVLLGTQTLGGAYSLARATLGQMVIRIALQCNEADAYLIMDDNNPAPRLLSRPGEGIYNDAAGAVEGNSPFQVCWLSDRERDTWLDRIRAGAQQYPALDNAVPIVFEGNAPADVRGNALLAHVLHAPATKAPTAARAWIGAPNSIKGPTELVFQRQAGANLLVVGQRDESALTMLCNCLIALTAQYPAPSARFVFLHTAAPGSADLEFLENVAEMSRSVVLATSAHLEDVMNELSADLKARVDGKSDSQEVFLLVHGLQRFKKLRNEDEFDFTAGDGASAKPGAQFGELNAEGAANGIHVLVSVDTFSSVNRFISRRALGGFEMRVVFQMSANDSASLIDSPAGGNLGLHRAIYYNEREGSLEVFRPYARPDSEWLENAPRPAPTGV
jgi:DNA segregation ATPase FtsK/SpoIIIE, S-DNA-T family